MALLKTYSIASDITSRKLDSSSLVLDIKSGGYITAFEGIEVDGDAIKVNGGTLDDEAGLDAELLGHTGVKTKRPLKCLLPCMTTAERTAETNVEGGVEVWDTDLLAVYIHNGTSWSAR